jgi:hypothetical protein
MATSRKDAPPEGNGTPPAEGDEPAVTMQDVAALTGAPDVSTGAKVVKPAPFMSEGMRHDIETIGWAVDPSSGHKFTRDDLA